MTAQEASEHFEASQEQQQEHGDQTMCGMFEELEQEQQKEAESNGGTQQNIDQAQVEVDCKSELDRYKVAKGQVLSTLVDGKRTYNNPLDWWKENHHRFPVLAKMARIYLAVQATSAPAERVFSRASRLLSSKRSSMSPHFASKTFFVAENWDFFEDQVKLAEVELAEEDVDDDEDNGW